MKATRFWGAAVLVVLAMALAGGVAAKDQTGPAAGSGHDAPPTPAKVMTMARRDITLDKSYPAKLRSNRQATVIARVKGLLEKRYFRPGQQVAKGDLLYTIEPDPYQATVNLRKANLRSARAKADQARKNSDRAKKLRGRHAISQQDAEEAIAKTQVAEAAIAQAKAALESARIDLGYTRVTAPVAGRIGLSEINVGNVVSPGTPLVTITQLSPLEVRFQLPQVDAFELRRQRDRQNTKITAALDFPNSRQGAAVVEGTLDFLGSSVSQETSTVAAQAVFDNPDHLYLPGQFVRVHLKGLKRYQVLAVPEIAVTQGLLGPQVFTLDKNNVTHATNVKLGEEAGPWIIISNGLKPGDRVIVSDPGAIQAGMKIKPEAFEGGSGQQSAGNKGGQGDLALDEPGAAPKSGQDGVSKASDSK